MSNRITRFLQNICTTRIDLTGAENVGEVKDFVITGPKAPVFEEAMQSCEKCGGFFKLESLNPVQRIDIFTDSKGKTMMPHLRTVFYCMGCRPSATVILFLRDFEGDEVDTQHFDVSEGYFHPIDHLSGEEQFYVSLDEYSHTFCSSCSELIEETECQKCRRPTTNQAKKS